MLVIHKKYCSIRLIVPAALSLCLSLTFSSSAWSKPPLDTSGEIKKLTKEFEDLGKSAKKGNQDAEQLVYEKKAEECLKAEKYAEAVENCTKAINSNPEDLHAYRLRGIAYLRMGDPEKAKSDQDKLIELQQQISARNCKDEIMKYSSIIKSNPKNAKAYASRAAAYMNLNQYQEAVQDSSKAISLDPKNKYAYFTRMAAYRALHEDGKAELDSQHFQELDHGDKMRLNNSAIDDYSKILEANANDTNALINRARAYFEVGQFAGAKKDCDSLLKLKAHTAEVREMRNRCLQEIRRQSTKTKRTHP